jgi:hypothetical protein
MIVTRARAGRILDLGQFVCWAYGAQRVVQATGRALHALESGADGWAVLSRSADGCALAAELHELDAGGAIDGGGPIRGVPPAVHPDAEALHEMVLSLPREDGRLIVRYGQTGEPPDWVPGGARLRQVPNTGPGRTRYRVDYRWELVAYAALQDLRRRYGVVDARGRAKFPAAERGFTYRARPGGGGHPMDREVRVVWCPLVACPAPEEVDRRRQEYRRWWHAMRALQAEITGRSFIDHEVTEFRAPAAPWESAERLSEVERVAIESFRTLLD